jgi:hypothetical protein
MAGNAGVAKAVVAETNPIRTTHGGLDDVDAPDTLSLAEEEVDSCAVVLVVGPAL